MRIYFEIREGGVIFSKETLKLVNDGLDLVLGGSEFHKRMVLGKKECLWASIDEEGITKESGFLMLGFKSSLGIQINSFLIL